MKKAAVVLLAVVAVLALVAVAAFARPGSSAAAAPAVQTGTPVADSTNLETCTICHKNSGSEHQAFYNQLYQDQALTVSDIAYSFKASPDTTTITFKLLQNGQPVDPKQVDNVTIYWVPFKDGKFQFEPVQDRLSLKGKLATDGKGTVTSTLTELDKADKSFVDYTDVSKTPGVLVVYGRDETIGTIPGTRVTQNKFPFAGLLKTGTVNYTSSANVAGCVKCHTDPYLKHGYIYGTVDNDPTTDFYTCKACHLDNGQGGHYEWQLLVNDPQLAAKFLGEPDEEKALEMLSDQQKKDMAYTTSVMNDVHMSHAMEFPYPQSMANCVTCHEGKLDKIVTDANFKIATCKSCHPMTGAKAEAKEGATPAYDTTTLALKTIIPASVHGTMDLNTTDCTTCHGEGKPAASFKKIHPGYDQVIYTADGLKYSDNISVTITSVAFDGTKLDIKFAANAKPAIKVDAATITPTVLVGLYGWDTNDFVIGPHERSVDDNKDGKVDNARESKDQRNLEAEVGADHPRMKTVSAKGGQWEMTADLSAWANLIKDGTVKRVQVAVMPKLMVDGTEVAVSATSRTFDLNAKAFDDKAFGEIASVAKCDNCHAALAVGFHEPSYGGDLPTCRMCHIAKSGGSHLEMQSRQLTSYVHAIHQGQAFDVQNIDFKDPYQALKYEEHISMPFPTHANTNCEACHVPGAYETPDQAEHLPTILSASAKNDSWGRKIGTVPSMVVGPATSACGGCHRAQEINEDKAGGLAVLNKHFVQGGYEVPAGQDAIATWQKLTDGLFSLFK